MVKSGTPRNYRLPQPQGFRLRPTVLSHGWVFLAPFAWNGRELTLRLATKKNRANLLVASEKGALRIRAEGRHDPDEALAAVRWTLRLDEDLSALRKHATGDPLVTEALRQGAGRLLRAPTLWEEAARILCTTNVQWGGTAAMMEGLVRLGKGYFPTPADVLQLGADRLKSEARMGYRAASLVKLAEHIEGGFDLEAWQTSRPSHEELSRAIQGWHGFGPYATAHMLVQLGHYGRLPIDSEVRAFHVSKSGRPLSDARINALYAPYGDFAFLAYKLRRIALRKNWIGEEVSGASTE